MTLLAKDIMVTSFDKINQEALIEEASRMILNGRVRETGHKTISLIVVDDYDHLVGILSMFDILYHLRPTFLNFGIDGHEFQWDGQISKLVQELKDKKVGQIMSQHVIGASIDEHLIVVLDRMIKNKFRRLPVLENNKPIGVIYLSDIYNKVFL
ncbi:MAG: CBS domain-containing protein [Deltaproteobacteria bacterium]|nr:CBS domain-containing protein [Deltaproteobacteria bacterium]